MLQLMLWRHGQAEPQASSDAARPLTQIGTRQVAEVVERRRESLAAVTEVWISPYVRAVQTAAIGAQCIAESAVWRRDMAHLIPEADPAQLLDRLAATTTQSLLLVGHQPLLGTVLNALCGAEAGRYSLSTGALACLQFPVGIARQCGDLQWLDTP